MYSLSSSHRSSQRSPRSPGSKKPHKQVKFRRSCDGCLEAKVRCSKHKPTCHRCLDRGQACAYGVSYRGGRKPSPNILCLKQDREEMDESLLRPMWSPHSTDSGTSGMESAPSENFESHQDWRMAEMQVDNWYSEQNRMTFYEPLLATGPVPDVGMIEAFALDFSWLQQSTLEEERLPPPHGWNQSQGWDYSLNDVNDLTAWETLLPADLGLDMSGMSVNTNIDLLPHLSTSNFDGNLERYKNSIVHSPMLVADDETAFVPPNYTFAHPPWIRAFPFHTET